MKTFVVIFNDGSKVNIQAEAHTGLTGGFPVTFTTPDKKQVAVIKIDQVRAIVESPHLVTAP